MIPQPRNDDADDIRWALSTAAALWQSGASSDALRWLRRAAESANDSDDDVRALELFKAAASIASSIPPPAESQVRAIAKPASTASVPPPLPKRASPPPPPPPARASRLPSDRPSRLPPPARLPNARNVSTHPIVDVHNDDTHDPASDDEPTKVRSRSASPGTNGTNVRAIGAARTRATPASSARAGELGYRGGLPDKHSTNAGRAAPRKSLPPVSPPSFGRRAGSAPPPVGAAVQHDSDGLASTPALSTVPTIRVALVASAIPGEFRAIPLARDARAPKGAAEGMLVVTAATLEVLTALVG